MQLKQGSAVHIGLDKREFYLKQAKSNIAQKY